MDDSWVRLILGKLQKLRRVLKKNRREDRGVVCKSSSISNPGGDAEGRVTSECSEETVRSSFDLAELRDQLEERAVKTTQPDDHRLHTGKSPPGIPVPERVIPRPMEPERPPRPTPPKPDEVEMIELEDDEESDASASSEEMEATQPKPALQLPPNPVLMQAAQLQSIPLLPLDQLHMIRMTTPAMVREKLAELFAVEEIGTVPLSRVQELRRYLQNYQGLDSFFEAIPLIHLEHLSINIIETILHLVEELEEINDAILRHSRTYLNFMYLCGSRSLRFRRTFEKHTALHWLALLRFEPLRSEVAFSLFIFSSHLCILYTDENFMHLLAELVTIYQSYPESSEQRSHISGYVTKLLQEFPFFLFRAYSNLSRPVFNELLNIIERIVRAKSDEEKKIPMLPSAVHFLIKIFDISIDDFREDRVDWHLLVGRLVSLMEIMAHIIRNIHSFRCFFEKPAIMHNVCAFQNLLLAGDELLRSGATAVNTTRGRLAINSRQSNVTRRVSGGGVQASDDGSIVDDLDQSGDGPPEKKYTRRSLEHDSIAHAFAISQASFPLPSVEILEADSSSSFRTKEFVLNLYRMRRISAFYILNMKRATMRLLGCLCVAASSNRDIAAEYQIVESIFKTARTGDSVKVDYMSLVKRALVEICLNHKKNLEALDAIEHRPVHLISKDDVQGALLAYPQNGNTV